MVVAPRGNYLFRGHLIVPPGVTLRGVWESVPSHNGIRDANLPKPTDDGTTLLVTEGAGNEEGTPFITLNTNSTLKGVVLYYPDQNPAEVPQPFRHGRCPGCHSRSFVFSPDFGRLEIRSLRLTLRRHRLGGQLFVAGTEFLQLFGMLRG